MQKTVIESENSDNWPIRNSVYFTSIYHNQNLLTLIQNLLIFSQNCRYLDTIPWSNQFASSCRNPFHVKKKCDFSSILFKINIKWYLTWFCKTQICPNILWFSFIGCDIGWMWNCAMQRLWTHQVLLMFLQGVISDLIKKGNYRPQMKLGQGHIFSSVCQEFCSGGSAPLHAGIHLPEAGRDPPGADTPSGADPSVEQTPPGSRHHPCIVQAGRYGQQAGGTHPTWMHTCYTRCVCMNMDTFFQLSLWSKLWKFAKAKMATFINRIEGF